MLWECYGNDLGMLWECFVNSLGLLWECFGNCLKCLGNALGRIWECFHDCPSPKLGGWAVMNARPPSSGHGQNNSQDKLKNVDFE